MEVRTADGKLAAPMQMNDQRLLFDLGSGERAEKWRRLAQVETLVAARYPMPGMP